MRKLFLFLVIFLTYGGIASAACLDNNGRQNQVAVTSSSAGTQVVSGISGGCSVVVDPSSTTGSAWISRFTGTCSTGVTSYTGTPVSVESGTLYSPGWEFIPAIDNYFGQLCAILESGSTAINLCVECW